MPQNQPTKPPLKDQESPWSIGKILLLEESKRSIIEKKISRKSTTLTIETPLILILQERKESVMALSLNRMTFSPVLKIRIQLLQILIRVLTEFKKGNIIPKNGYLLEWISNQIRIIEELEKQLGGKEQASPSFAPRIRTYSKKNWIIRWVLIYKEKTKEGIATFILSDGMIQKELSEKEFDLLIKEQTKRYVI